MPIEFRYHLASLIAIFFALIIGILVGIGLVGDPGRVERLTREMKAEFRRAREENRDSLRRLEARLRLSQEFASQSLPHLIRGRLAGKKVAILSTHPLKDDSFLKEISQTIQQAGGTVTSLTTLLAPLLELQPSSKERLAQRLPWEREITQGVVVSRLVRQMSQGIPQFAFFLERIGLVRLSGDYGAPIQAMVVAGGAMHGEKMALEEVDIPLLRALKEAGVRAVACEREGAEVSVAARYAREGSAVVDNADSLAGKAALVLALQGARGHFGAKAGARLLPPPS